MAKGQNANQAPKAPPEPKTVISVTTNPSILNGDLYETQINVRVVRNGNVWANGQVNVYRGANRVASLVLGVNGEVSYVHPEPSVKAGQSIPLVFRVDTGEAAETTINIDLLAKVNKGIDPVYMSLRSFVAPNWQATVRAHVLNVNRAPMEGVEVDFLFDGQTVTISTNKKGIAEFVPGRVLRAGERTTVEASTDGIPDGKTKVRLRRPPAWTPASVRWSTAWWFGNNNGRALLYIIIAMILAIICFNVGFGDPLFGDSAKLTVHQEKFNAIAKDFAPEAVVKAPVSKGTWQHWLWLVTIPFAIFSLLNIPYALRDELADGCSEALDILLNKYSATASDPLIDQLAHWSGNFARLHKNQIKTSVGVSEAKADNSEDKGPSFFKMFKTEMAVEMLVTVIPALYRSITKK